MAFLDTATRLIAVRSTADQPSQLLEALDLVLAEVGPGFTVERFQSHGKPSALVYAGPSRPHFHVVLNAHLDVVPGTDPQFSPTVLDGRLYGRGTHDMKLAALVMAQVFTSVARDLPYPLGLQLVTDEEVGGHDGTAHQIAAGVTADFVVIGEQSALRIVTDSKGILQVRVHATGVAAHAAYPWLGENALLTLTAALDRILTHYPVPSAESWTTTVNVARIETSNQATNQVPSDATAWLDIRFPPDDASINGRTPDDVASYLSTLAGLPVTVDSFGPPHHASQSSPFVSALREAAVSVGYTGDFLRKHGAADGRFYYAAGTDAVIFGPGGDGQHGPAEYADLATIEPYRQALTTFLQTL
ncbi:M20 family metallopeptidase [Winogradskya humida]|uniref:Peptidase M20 n=1 Tax=Winogradskya humida TaxID=113566 RepID=A0ABQ3ZIC3_9ACTN|nr:M20/M25/M40 family metallo-hydrolase [Actinoplanes humidus]GIE18218.1 peptidase M20 [Actinoplanes humidus]